MHYSYRNINEAFTGIVKGILNGIIQTTKKESKKGNLVRINGPATLTYLQPKERVLFNPVQDTNPFFNLYKSLWTLAGYNDVKSLKYYVDDIDQFSDNGKTFNGAYGYRWRNHPVDPEDYMRGIKRWDQLSLLIKHLSYEPDSNRAVLQMWNVEDDLFKIGGCCKTCGGSSHVNTPRSTENYLLRILLEEDKCPECNLSGLTVGSKDVCRDLSIVFEIEDNALNMTVFNRSNDMLEDMFGANAVPHSFLHEYVAANLSIKIGHYHQVTSTLFFYESKWQGKQYLEYPTTMWSSDYRNRGQLYVPLIDCPKTFEIELLRFVAYAELPLIEPYTEPFLETVAKPMCQAFKAYKEDQDYAKALAIINTVCSSDWREAGQTWILKRKKQKGN